MRINISRKLNVLAHFMKGYGQSAASATVAEVAQVEARTAASCLSRQLQTDHEWQAACSRFEAISGKTRA